LGRYAIAVYDSAHEKPGLWPDSVQIVDNTILNPVSCGVYVAAARNLDISRNRISGQTDRWDGTLPKGAIALNHAFNVRSVEGNELTNNYVGITVVAGDVTIKENRIDVPQGGIRTKIFRDEHRPPTIER
jgi:nitrous oxidase accessory protein NosD